MRVILGLQLVGAVERVRRLVFGDLGLMDLREWREATFRRHVCGLSSCDASTACGYDMRMRSCVHAGPGVLLPAV